MFPKITNVKIIGEYTLLVTFDNNTKKTYDLSSKLSDKRFEILKNKAIFNSVKIDKGGYGISWNDITDLSESELWTNGKKIK